MILATKKFLYKKILPIIICIFLLLCWAVQLKADIPLAAGFKDSAGEVRYASGIAFSWPVAAGNPNAFYERPWKYARNTCFHVFMAFILFLFAAKNDSLFNMASKNTYRVLNLGNYNAVPCLLGANSPPLLCF